MIDPKTVNILGKVYQITYCDKPSGLQERMF